jgi:DNA-binding transcriptional LysR family regulator
MDFKQIEGFVRVAELASFTQAADSLGLPKASVSSAVQQLEARLGARLLQRTTRRVQLSDDGRLYYERCRDLLADMDELNSLFCRDDAPLSGRVRVDMPVGVARHAVLPRLPEFLARHPGLSVELSNNALSSGQSKGYTAAVEIRLEVPVRFLGNLLPAAEMMLHTEAKYVPVF